jgi:hypothetical protein
LRKSLRGHWSGHGSVPTIQFALIITQTIAAAIVRHMERLATVCLLIAETSCEMRNLFLDRNLLVPTMGTDGSAFFRFVEGVV